MAKKPPVGAMVGSGVGLGVGAAVGGPAGAMIGASMGGMVGGMFDKDSGPDYTNVTNQFNARNAQIAGFAKQLAGARAKYLSSLNNMYNSAYARFSGNAEAGFASRGMSVSGGAFASTLAKQTAQYQSELEPLAFQAEREDLSRVDSAYGANSGSYMGAISGGPGMQYQAENQNMRDIGGFAGQLAMMKYGSTLRNSANAPGATPSGAYENPTAYPRDQQYNYNRLDLSKYGTGDN